jgi:hypothetical protein
MTGPTPKVALPKPPKTFTEALEPAIDVERRWRAVTDPRNRRLSARAWIAEACQQVKIAEAEAPRVLARCRECFDDESEAMRSVVRLSREVAGLSGRTMSRPLRTQLLGVYLSPGA